MRKIPFAKRIIVSVLSVAMLLTSMPVSASDTSSLSQNETVATVATSNTLTTASVDNKVCTFTWSYTYYTIWPFSNTDYYYANVYAVDTNGNPIAITNKYSTHSMSESDNLDKGVSNNSNLTDYDDYFQKMVSSLGLTHYSYVGTHLDNYTGTVTRNISFNNKDNAYWHSVPSTNGWSVWKTSKDSTVNVYMVFQEDPKYTVTYKQDWQTVLNTETNIYTGTTITLPDSTQYATDTNVVYSWSDGTTTYNPGSTYTVTGDVTMTANYGCQITYKDGDTTVGTTVIANNGGADFPSVSKDGYKLAGWSDGTTTWSGTNYWSITRNTTFTAVWSKLYTVTLNVGTGTLRADIASQTPYSKTEGETITLPDANAVTKASYTLTGWTDGTNTYAPGATYTVGTADVTLSAVWTNKYADSIISTVDTISKGVTINLFDYKVNTSSSTSESVNTVNIGAGYGINASHNLKFMNSASNNDVKANSYTGGKYPQTGIVASSLNSNGYPKLSGTSSVWGSSGATDDLDYLFDDSDIANAKKSYLNANYLFTLDADGYYSYDSDSNFATIADTASSKAGEYDFTVYNEKVSGFFPFTSRENIAGSSEEPGPSGNGDTLGSNAINHYFGMSMETEFIQPADGRVNGKDMVFEFSGDDDVWVYVDGELVLDLGGIHQKVSGSINFATGVVTVNGTQTATFEKYADYTTHTLKLFYLERGCQASNCKIKFNLQTIPKGSLYVAKNATNVADNDTSDYVFTLKDSDGDVVSNASYTIDDGSTVYKTNASGEFTLKNGQHAIISDLDEDTYTVTETEVKNSNNSYTLSDFSTKISVNGGTATTITAASGKVRSAEVAISDAHSSSVDFRNLKISEEVTNTASELAKKIAYDSSSDTYNLSLTFKGPKSVATKTEYEESSVQNAKVDIVLVMDISGSMDGTNLANAKSAVATMVSAFNVEEGETDTVDERWKLVTFAKYASIVTSDWVSGSTLNSKVQAISNPNGGTNYQAAFVKTEEAVETARSDAQTIVIFVTDGEPTYYVHDDGTIGGQGNKTSENVYNGSIKGAQALTCDTFYGVGIGLVTDTVYSYKENGKTVKLDGEALLTKVAEATNSTKHEVENKKPSELSDLFSDIAGKIIEDTEGHVTSTYSYASNVQVTDTLSEYADIVDGSSMVISVKDSFGKSIDGTAVNGVVGSSTATYTFNNGKKDITLTASYSSDSKRVTLDFPDDYELDQDYTYGVNFVIKASDAAYAKYAANDGAYDKDEAGNVIVGDEGTDADSENKTSEGMEGFRSNAVANATYTFKTKSVTETYKHPVIQVHDRYDWQLVKASSSTSTTRLTLQGAEFKLTDKTDKSIVYTGVSGEDGVVNWQKDGADADVVDGTYILTETKAPAGYAKDSTEWEITVSMRDGLTVTTANDFYDESVDKTSATDDHNMTVETIYFEDEANYELPETGGFGIFVFMFAGMGLMLLGATYIFLMRRKKYMA